MKGVILVVFRCVLIGLGMGEKIVAKNSAQVSKLISEQRHSHKIIALFFRKIPADSATDGIFTKMKNKVFTGVSNLFSSEQTPDSYQSEIDKQQSILVEIDVDNPDLKAIEDFYHVSTVPYLIVIKNYDVLYEGIPDLAKLKDIMETEKA